MSKYIHKSHNVTVLLYHLVFPAKYRKAVINEDVDQVMKNICLEIGKRYQINFLEIGIIDKVNFLTNKFDLRSSTEFLWSDIYIKFNAFFDDGITLECNLI